jgi:hypothetical protein
MHAPFLSYTRLLPISYSSPCSGLISKGFLSLDPILKQYQVKRVE